jgi:hypothetical protein
MAMAYTFRKESRDRLTKSAVKHDSNTLTRLTSFQTSSGHQCATAVWSMSKHDQSNECSSGAAHLPGILFWLME